MNTKKIPVIKYVENLKISQLFYSSFCSLKNKFTQRLMLLKGVLALLCGDFHGRIAPLEERLTTKYASDDIRYTICRSSIDYDSQLYDLERLTITMVIKLAIENNQPILLIIDDMLVEKDNRSISLPKGGKKKNIEGYSMLTALLVVGQISFTLTPRLCFRKDVSNEIKVNYVSKIDKAIELINHLFELGLPNERVIILTDNWYSSNKMVNLCNEKGCSYVLGIKSNRQLNGKRVDVHNRYINRRNSHNLNFDEHEYNLSVRHGTLNNIKEKQNVLISKRTTKSTGKVTYRYFITNLKDAFVINYWREKRWYIETFHQIFKDHFKPCEWRIHGERSTTNLLILIGISMYFSIDFYLKNNIVDVSGLEHKLHHNIMSESLNFIRSTLISNREAWENIFRKRE